MYSFYQLQYKGGGEDFPFEKPGGPAPVRSSVALGQLEDEIT